MSIAIRLFGGAQSRAYRFGREGWTDTPPYCMYAGGNVVNVAIELNGQPPLQVYVKPARESRIILRSIDIGAMECISTWDELRDFN